MIHIFIINYKLGPQNWSKHLREQLSLIENFHYYVFSAKYSENETEIVKRIIKTFEGEYLRIYACGDSRTMQRVLDGIDSFERVELALYPVGSNDFISIFGEDKKYFYDINNLINGDVRYIDYIMTNHGKALNAFSVGLDSQLLGVSKYVFELFPDKIKFPYLLGLIHSIFVSKNIEYKASFGEHEISGVASEIMLLNGNKLAGLMSFSDNNNITDGLGYYAFFPIRTPFGRMRAVRLAIKKSYEKLEKLCHSGLTLSLSLKAVNGELIAACLDGEIKKYDDWQVKIVHKGLPFVIPKEVKF